MSIRPLLAGLLVAALAALPRPAAAGDEGVPMWVLEGAQAYAVRNCELVPVNGKHAFVPAGLTGLGVVQTGCVQYVRLKLTGKLRGQGWVHVAVDAVTTKRPKRNAWEDAPVVAQRWIRDGGSTWAIPLDGADASELVPVREGERVDVLEESSTVVRTVTGREVLLFPGVVHDKDPVAKTHSVDRGAARDRWEQGRRLRERDRTLAPLPSSEALLANRRQLDGGLFVLKLDPATLSEPEFETVWLDPVEEVLRGVCPEARRTDRGQPCGTYRLDYRALGAWWPSRKRELIVEADGTGEVDGVLVPRLRVLVIDPWNLAASVGPEWSEGRGK